MRYRLAPSARLNVFNEEVTLGAASNIITLPKSARKDYLLVLNFLSKPRTMLEMISFIDDNTSLASKKVIDLFFEKDHISLGEKSRLRLLIKPGSKANFKLVFTHQNKTRVFTVKRSYL